MGTFAWFVYGLWKQWKWSELRGTSKRKYNGLLVHHVLPAFGHLPMREITWQHVQSLKDNALRHDRRKKPSDKPLPLSQRHIREIILLAKDIFAFALLVREMEPALAKYLPEKNPCAIVRLPEVIKGQTLEEPEDDFTEKLMAHAVKLGEPHRILTLFLASFLGFRRGEICGLPKPAIKRKRLEIEVYTQLQPYEGDVPTKGAIRVIPITDVMLAFIDRYIDRSHSPYVVTQEGKPLSPNEVSKWIPDMCEAAGLQRFTLHQLRHLAASNLADMGVDPFVIMEILGHTDLRTTVIYLNKRKTSKAKRQALSALFDARKVG